MIFFTHFSENWHVCYVIFPDIISTCSTIMRDERRWKRILKTTIRPKKHIYSTSSEAFLTSTRHHQSWAWDKNPERHTNATLQNLNTKQSRMSDSVINWLISVLEKKKDFFQAGLNKVLWWCNLPASRHHELHVQHSLIHWPTTLLSKGLNSFSNLWCENVQRKSKKTTTHRQQKYHCQTLGFHRACCPGETQIF